MSLTTKSKNGIYMADWEKYRPFQISSPTDIYYLKLSNQIFKKLLSETLACGNLSLETKKVLSIVVACYLEDVVSNFGIFNSFREKHKELYQKNLPFFEEEDYLEDEVNLSDIRFLVWYVISIREWTEKEEEKLIPHDHIRLTICSNVIYSIIEEEFEFAPENENFYKTTAFCKEDTGIIRGFCWEMAKSNYLYGLDFNRKFDILLKDLKKYKNHESYSIVSYLKEVEFGMKTRSSLLAMDIFEITARILGKKSPFYASISGVIPEKYYCTSFQFLKIENGFIHLEHISTKKRINLLEKSFPETDKLTSGNYVMMGIVKTTKGWSFCGISSINEWDSRRAEKTCNDEKMTVFIFDEEDKTKNASVLEEQSDFFKEMNQQSFVVVPKDEVGNFNSDYYRAYYKKFSQIDLSDPKAIERMNYIIKEMKNFENGAENDVCIFNNPKAGFEFFNDLGECLPVKNNPYFKEVSERDIIDLILNEFYSTEFFNEVIDLYFEKEVFSTVENCTFTRNEFDFLKRFYSHETYKTKSRLKVFSNE